MSRIGPNGSTLLGVIVLAICVWLVYFVITVAGELNVWPWSA